MIRLFKLLLCFFYLTFPIAGIFAQTDSYQPPVVTQYTLENGLTIILSEIHDKPEIFGLMATRAGSKNDPADATGMAHYQEHMLFKGSTGIGTTNWEAEKPFIDKIFALYDQLGKTSDPEERKKIQADINDQSLKAAEFEIPNEFDKILKGIGGTNMNANTSWDRTVYFNAFPANQLEKWLQLYSHRFEEPVFRLFQAELEVIYEEKNLYNDMFQTKMIEEFMKSFFKNHPYGQQNSIGTTEHLKNPSLTKMVDFYKKYYVPNNMALVLCGDFKTEEIKPLIEKYFGKWKRVDVPAFPEYKETPFNGREFVEMKLTPIKLGILGFRTVPAGDPDEVPLEICNYILSNSGQTGLLDKLTIDNKLLAAMMMEFPLNDHGASILFIIPKILGQKLEDAEALVMAEIEKVGKGDFPDWMIESIKYDLYKSFVRQLESEESRGEMLAEVFAQNRNVEDYMRYPKKILAVTKEDVVRVAQKYYGKNYLAFYSRMGFPKKDKLDKPGYKPVPPKKDAKSTWAENFENIKPPDPSENFVDFRKDLKIARLGPLANMTWVSNPVNDVFTLTLKYGTGEYKSRSLKYAAQIMEYAGTSTYNANDLKAEFSKTGTTCSFYTNNSYLVVELEGLDKNLPRSLDLLGELLSKPVVLKEKLDIIIEAEKSNRKLENSEPDAVADALFQWVRKKENSTYLNRLSMKEVSNLNVDSLVAEFKRAQLFEAEIYYTGTNSPENVKQLLQEKIGFKNINQKSDSPVVIDAQEYNENTIFFVNRKDALQSKMYLLVNGEPFKTDQDPYINAFNQYFNGDFSGLVLQEVREYRSLAYGASADYIIPVLENKKAALIGYVGTQADKTVEAAEVFTGLLKNMPEKPERINTIRDYLSQSALTSRPGFRYLGESVQAWKLLGYHFDPNQVNYSIYTRLKFSDITDFYTKYIKSKPIVFSVVGDKKRIDMKGLEKYGKIIKVKEKDLYR